ncbi:MAG: Ni/Fe hydrogenase subunit alpha [Planctomycetota bacterium]
MSTTRTIRVETLTRVEGEGALNIVVDGHTVRDVQLAIYEPPRFFEAFLRGRPLEDVPDLTARICGICPVAYQLTSVQALEQALSIRITPEIRRLRRLLYCAEWIESHALHIHLLHAPDFFGEASGIDLARRFPLEINRGLTLKKYGNQLLEVLGGRAIHPVNVAVGGFHRAPRVDELQALIPRFEEGCRLAADATRWFATLPFPDFRCDWELTAMQHPDEYPMNEGEVCSTSGSRVAVADFESVYVEEHVAHSTALQACRLPDRATYCVGPAARISLNRSRLHPSALQVADEIGFSTPCQNPFMAILARSLEVLHAFAEALDILRDYRGTRTAKVHSRCAAGSGSAATEAPRGLIYQRYAVDDAGKVVSAKIMPPTSQNQRQIELDLMQWLPPLLQLPDQQIADECEKLIRTWDPCISCSTHFLKLSISRHPSA